MGKRHILASVLIAAQIASGAAAQGAPDTQMQPPVAVQDATPAGSVPVFGPTEIMITVLAALLLWAAAAQNATLNK